ncbi:hypothetical protein BJV78DRAFT_1246861 [Lactifluus subvellereus]|nr:hypothetical protein BJV78DRAFT_1246861 [Lactifluus subvellereus]
MLEGQPVFEVDMAALADKAWPQPGSDISDWFNYRFDEISWKVLLAARAWRPRGCLEDQCRDKDS